MAALQFTVVKCSTPGCENFGNEKNDGKCNGCTNYKDSAPAPPVKRIKLEPLEYPPLVEGEKLTAEKYKSASAEERGNYSVPQIRDLYQNLFGKNFRGSLASARKQIDINLGIPKTCICGCNDFVGIYSKACDGNYYTLPNGTEKGPTYLPSFSAIEGGDGPNFEFCVQCGRLYGFNAYEMQVLLREEAINDVYAEEEDGEGDVDEDEGEGEDEDEDGDEYE